jgi:aminopeptidase
MAVGIQLHQSTCKSGGGEAMNRERMETLTGSIVSRSLQLTPGQKLYIDAVGQADDLVESLIETVYQAGAEPYVRIMPTRHLKSIITSCNKGQIINLAKQELYKIRQMDAFVGIRADENRYEFADIDPEKYNLYVKHYLQPVQAAMASLNRWLLVTFPTYGLAQTAKMSLQSLTDLYFQACNFDYEKMSQLAQPLQRLLEATDQVRIIAPDTDLQFSIGNIPLFLCDGRYNLPDGEIFTAPRLDSVEGVITFNVPTSYMGIMFENVRLEFEKGKVVSASANDTKRLWDILNTDEGSARVGEFGIGLNTVLQRSSNILLFDEKMAGSIHLALGQAYDMADNGNKSVIHWDLVLSQQERDGGGEMYFDDVLIRQNGLFVHPDLEHLNQL